MLLIVASDFAFHYPKTHIHFDITFLGLLCLLQRKNKLTFVILLNHFWSPSVEYMDLSRWGAIGAQKSESMFNLTLLIQY